MSKGPDDLPPEAARAVPLAVAYRDHADVKLIRQYHLIKERLDREGRWQYVGTPDDLENRVLSEFDTLGHALLKEARELLRTIDEGLLAKLRQGELAAWAREGSPLAAWREIPAAAWTDLRLDDVIKGTVKGSGVSLFEVRIGSRHVEEASVELPRAELPPVELSPVELPPAPVRPLPTTGAPGRPSNMHLIEAEFSRRRDTGSIENSLNREAAALAVWFKLAHPDKQSVSAKTIANRLRPQYREATSR